MKKSAHREKTNRNLLLDACVEALKKHGLRGLKMNHIIDESGFSRRTVYKYFPNKEELIKETFDRESRRYYDDVKNHVAEIKSVEDIFVQGFLYSYETLPHVPILITLINETDLLLKYLGQAEKTLMETLISGLDLGYAFDEFPKIKEDIFELSQYWVQILVSFIQLDIGKGMTSEQIEAYVRKRFVPGLQLEMLMGGMK